MKTVETPMKGEFIHTFKNGNRCKLKLDFSGDIPVNVSKWMRDPEWKEIEQEYLQWVNVVQEAFMQGMTLEELTKVISMCNEARKKK